MDIRVDGARLAVDRVAGAGPTVVLLHAGVCDRRSWYEVMDRLDGIGNLVVYDRRGFGDSVGGEGAYREVDDLIAVLDGGTGRAGEGPVWLIGSSMGGQVALDAALAYPDRVAGLVLFAPAVSGAPEPQELDPATQRLSDALDACSSPMNVDEVNRLETWLWLDGPADPEGRVMGPSRDLALAMNRAVLIAGAPEQAGTSGLAAWDRLKDVQVPVTVAWGDLDVPSVIDGCRQLAAHLPQVRTSVLSGTAHLPYLEDPDRVAEIVQASILND